MKQKMRDWWQYAGYVLSGDEVREHPTFWNGWRRGGCLGLIVGSPLYVAAIIAIIRR